MIATAKNSLEWSFHGMDHVLGEGTSSQISTLCIIVAARLHLFSPETSSAHSDPDHPYFCSVIVCRGWNRDMSLRGTAGETSILAVS